MSVKEISPRLYDERQLRALTGVSEKQFLLLLSVFESTLLALQQEAYQNKTRKPGSGRKGTLERPTDKLLFILYYLKCYPTFDHLGFTFGMDNSSAFNAVQILFPVLKSTLRQFNVLPQTQIDTPEEMHRAFGEIGTLLIDATERPACRPSDTTQQKEYYSGKKKQSCVKNTVIASLGLIVLYVGITFSGKNHDYGMFKKEFKTRLFEKFKLRVDLGYQGIESEYTAQSIAIPHKKPRKSKANPNPTLSDEQKKYNRELASQRVLVEHAIGGMKRYKCLADKFRNNLESGIDFTMLMLAAGLWNFNLIYK